MRKLLSLLGGVIFLFWVGTTDVFAVTSSTSVDFSICQPSVLKNDFLDFTRVGKKLAAAPFHFQRRQWILAAGAVGATVLLSQLDFATREFAQGHQNAVGNFLLNADRFYGNGLTVVGVMGLYGVGYLLKKNKIRKVGLCAAEAGGYAGTVTVVLKILFGRRRPYGGASPFYFKPFQLDNRYNSLPSGHTTVAFAVSTVLANSARNRFWKIFWYSAGALVAASRVYHNQHWVSDVFLGGAIGVAVGEFVVHFHRSPKKIPN